VSTHLKEKEEKILEMIEQLGIASSGGTPIIVEGKKDVETLRDLGITGRIFSIQTGNKNMARILIEIEETKINEIILLLDFDDQGREMTVKLKQNLERERIKPNTHFWSALKGIIGREVQCVEGIGSYLKTLKLKMD